MGHEINEFLRERYESCDAAIADSLERSTSMAARLLVGFTMLGDDIVPIPYLSTELILTQQTSRGFPIHEDLAKYHKDEMYNLKDLSPQPLWRMAVFGMGTVTRGHTNYLLRVETGFDLAVRELERKLALKNARQSVISALDSLKTRLTSPCVMGITTYTRRL